MRAKAKSKYVRLSPTKIRPYVNVVRGNTVGKALSWLKASAIKRTLPLTKLLLSVYHNAKNKDASVEMDSLLIKEIVVNRGPIYRYYKAGPMGRAAIQRKRLCHLEVTVEQV